MTPRVNLALPRNAAHAASLPAWSFVLISTIFAQDGYQPPPPALKTTKHVLSVAGWGGVVSLAPGSHLPPTSGSTTGAGGLLLLEGRAGLLVACFLQLSKQGELGRKPSALFRGLRQTLCHNKGTMTWMDRWVDGRLAPSALCFHI